MAPFVSCARERRAGYFGAFERSSSEKATEKLRRVKINRTRQEHSGGRAVVVEGRARAGAAEVQLCGALRRAGHGNPRRAALKRMVYTLTRNVRPCRVHSARRTVPNSEEAEKNQRQEWGELDLQLYKFRHVSSRVDTLNCTPCVVGFSVSTPSATRPIPSICTTAEIAPAVGRHERHASRQPRLVQDQLRAHRAAAAGEDVVLACLRVGLVAAPLAAVEHGLPIEAKA